MRGQPFRSLDLRPVLGEARVPGGPPAGQTLPLPLGSRKPPRPPVSARLPPLSARRADGVDNPAYQFEDVPGAEAAISGFAAVRSGARQDRRTSSVGRSPSKDRPLAAGSLLAKDLRQQLVDAKRSPREPLQIWAPPPTLSRTASPAPRAPVIEQDTSPTKADGSPTKADGFAEGGSNGIEGGKEPENRHDREAAEELEDEEVRGLIEHLRVLGQRLAEQTRARDSEAECARQLEEALRKEDARNAETQESVALARDRAEAAKQLRMSRPCKNNTKSANEFGRKLYDRDIEAAKVERACVQSELDKVERACVQSELDKVRHEHAQVLKDTAALRRAYAEEQPRVAELRDRLTALCVENQVARALQARLDESDGDDLWTWARTVAAADRAEQTPPGVGDRSPRLSSGAATVNEVSSDGGELTLTDLEVDSAALDELNREFFARIRV